ncbi:MAG: tetratricopeptide repeat protein [Phycisphaerales bacterium]|nr:MAG: tetratricopeptide repeat protein [Phycisphaerales bacterium]
MLLRTGLCLMLVSLCAVLACSKREVSVASQKQSNWLGVDASALASADEMPAPKILPETYFAAAQLLEAQGQWQKAIVQYRRATLTHHEFVAAFHRLGLALSHVGEFDEAIEALERAVMLRPDVAILYNNLGFAYAQARRYGDAELAFQEALKLEPDFARAHVNLAMTLARQGRFDAARDHFAAVLPESAVQYNLGVMYRGQDRIEDAALAFVRALELDPGMTAAAHQLELCVARLGPIKLTEPLAQVITEPAGGVITSDEDLQTTDGFNEWPAEDDGEPCEDTDGSFSETQTGGADSDDSSSTAPSGDASTTFDGGSTAFGDDPTTPTGSSADRGWNIDGSEDDEASSTFDAGASFGDTQDPVVQGGYENSDSWPAASGGSGSSFGGSSTWRPVMIFGGSSTDRTTTPAPSRTGGWAWFMMQSRQHQPQTAPAATSPTSTGPIDQPLSAATDDPENDDANDDDSAAYDGDSALHSDDAAARGDFDADDGKRSFAPSPAGDANDESSADALTAADADDDAFAAFVLYPATDEPAVNWAAADVWAATTTDDEVWRPMDADLGWDYPTPTGRDTLSLITGTSGQERSALLEPLSMIRSQLAGPWPSPDPWARPVRWNTERAARIAQPTPQP